LRSESVGKFSGKITSPLALGLLLAVLTFATLSPLLHAGFLNYDDQVYVTNNARVKAGLTPDNVEWAFENLYFGFYYPLTWLSHMTDCQMFGLNAAGHHLTSLLIHVANALLLFLFLLKATGAKWRSWLVSAFFALHPLHVESVAWIAERKDVLSTLFLFLSLLAYLHYSRKPTVGRYALLFALFALGLMSKSMIITAPVVFLLLDFWPLGRSAWSPWAKDIPDEKEKKKVASPKFSPRLLMLEKIPLLLLSAIFAALTFMAQNRQDAVIALSRISFWTRLGNAAVSYATYIQKMALPFNLAILYTYPAGGWPYWKITLSVLLLVLLTALVFKLASERPYLAVGWSFYLVVVFPVCGLFQTGRQAYADHYTYVSLIGVFLMLVWSVAEWVKNNLRRRTWAAWSCAALLAVSALLSWNQAGYWKNSVTLYRHTLRITRDNNIIHFNLGKALLKRHDIEGAARQFETVLRINPANEKAHIDLGSILAGQGRFPAALRHYRKAIRIRPENEIAYTDMGVILGKQGKLEQAVKCHLAALRIKPDFLNARNNLGLVLAQQGKYRRAVAEFRKALLLEPRSAATHYHLGRVLAAMGNLQSATREYHLLESLNPVLAGRLLRKIAAQAARPVR